ncbi:MAG TPA: ATP-binding protein, partial [Gemmatimonadales bacterium]|nr:ATP-binding protein [Gemmatimonadales bacterium]
MTFDVLMTISNPRAPRSADPLGGGGELGRLMRATDWSRTPLGPVASWPQALRTAVRIMLTSRQPMFVWWGEQLINLYNDAYRSILGGKHPTALGQPASVVWREIWDQVEPRAAAAMSGNEGTYDEALLLIMERNGYPEETYYTFSYSPVPNEEGGAGGILCANTDDTRRIIGERQLALLRDLAAATGDARSTDDACRMAARSLLRNPRDLPFALIYLQEPGTERFALAGAAGVAPSHPIAPTAVGPEAPGPWPLAEASREGTTRVIDDLGALPHLPRGGWVLPPGAWDLPPSSAVAIPLPASGDTGRAGVLVAGLNRYRLLDEDYRGFLRLLAGQISAAIANAQAYEEERRRAEALAELDRAKTVFFSNVSHEFRTPLTLLLGPLEDLLATPTALPAEAVTELNVAHRNALRLLKLVNTLLDFSRIEAGRVQVSVEPTDLAALTAELASTFRSAIERAGLRFEVHCPPLLHPVHVDRDMWEKVVLNLISNALKYTFEGTIEVAVAASADGSAAELRVRDTGIGIPAEELPRLFERFHRVKGARGRSHEGTGIGLALVQDLVKLHRGTIAVASEPGQGTTFTVSLPFGTGHLPEPRPSAGPSLASTSTRAEAFVQEALRWSGPENGSERAASGVTRPRVLFADDNSDMREYVRRLLEPMYEVATVGDGEEALTRLRADRPDLLLTDVMMPRLDGVGLVQSLRADPTLRTLPVIMLSARAGEESRVSGLETGADDYLVKPFAARELIARVAATLHLAEIRAEAGEALRQSERRYRSLTQASAQVVWTADAAGEFSEPSRSWESFTGQRWEEYRGSAGFAAVHPDDRERVRAQWAATLGSGQPFEAAYRMRRDDGRWRQVLARGVPVRGEDGAIREWVGTITDVEDQRLAEERLRQAAKMEAVGRLAGGLAHDFNNQLQAVSGFVNFIDRDSSLPAGSRRDLHEIRKAAERMASLTRQLLAFSRQQVLSPETLDLNAAVADSQSLLQRLIGTDIEMGVSLGPGAKWVQVDRAQLLQVLMNLSINARDAMPDGGELLIRTGTREIPPDEAPSLPGGGVAPGTYASLTVSDTGSGIAPEHLAHIFEPFFTTKEVG